MIKKFNDKNYSHFRHYSGNKEYRLNDITPFDIGVTDDMFEDILFELSISDNGELIYNYGKNNNISDDMANYIHRCFLGTLYIKETYKLHYYG